MEESKNGPGEKKGKQGGRVKEKDRGQWGS